MVHSIAPVITFMFIQYLKTTIILLIKMFTFRNINAYTIKV